ncbi:MAG: cytochrome C oxidase subunit IV family protein [Myxococcales bacterium]|nr:cytochrome C oxidase subunit IV family protein [Myxococcales bacterium]
MAKKKKKSKAADDKPVEAKAAKKPVEEAEASADEAPADEADAEEAEDADEDEVEESEAVSEAPAAAAKAGHDVGHDDHAHGNRREVWLVFLGLFVLTVLEVGVAKMPGIGKTSLVVTLIGMALAKAYMVASYYMHLNHETKILKWSIAIPLGTPALYAVVLIAEATWRMLR